MTINTRAIAVVVAVLLAAFVVWRFAGERTGPPVPDAPIVRPPDSARDADAPSAPLPQEEPPPVRIAQSETPEAQPEDADSGLSAFRGVVRRADTGEPIAAFQLAYLEAVPVGRGQWRGILGSGGTSWQPFQSPEGTFLVEEIPANRAFALAAKAKGFEPAYAAVPAIAPGGAAEPIVIELTPETAVAGRVVALQGAPIPGAAVRLGERETGKVLARADSDGRFRIASLAGGTELVLSAHHPDYTPGAVCVTPTAGQVQEVEIVLGTGGFIEGTISCGAQPLPGAAVMVYDAGSFRKLTKSGAEGRYGVYGVPAGEVEVQVEADLDGVQSPRTIQRRALVEEDAATVVDFRFSTTPSSISGLVTLGGQPAVGGYVKAVAVGEGGDALLGARIGNNGAYLIENATPGEVWLKVTAKGADGSGRSRRLQVALSEGEHLEQDIAFDAAGAIEGTVSKLFPGASCTVLVFSGNREIDLSDPDRAAEVDRAIVASTPVDDSGHFRIGSIESGAYTIAAVVFDAGGGESPEVYATAQALTSTVTVEDGQTAVADFAF